MGRRASIKPNTRKQKYKKQEDHLQPTRGRRTWCQQLARFTVTLTDGLPEPTSLSPESESPLHGVHAAARHSVARYYYFVGLDSGCEEDHPATRSYTGTVTGHKNAIATASGSGLHWLHWQWHWHSTVNLKY